jgi:coenzyme PQQ precursor peptide PqqA
MPSSRHVACRDATRRTELEAAVCTLPTIMLRSVPSSNLPLRRPSNEAGKKSRKRPTQTQSEEMKMAWTTPVIVEVCVGMEVTSYSSAEI